MILRKATDQQIVTAIATYHQIHGFAPTIRNLMDMTGIQSSGTMSGRLAKIRDKGLIDYVDYEPRTITVNNIEDPMNHRELSEAMMWAIKNRINFIYLDDMRMPDPDLTETWIPINQNDIDDLLICYRKEKSKEGKVTWDK